MKAKRVVFSRLFNTGDYNNQKVEIELEVEEGEKASDVLTKAKAWVDYNGPRKENLNFDYERAKKQLVPENRDNLTMNQIKVYEKVIADYEAAQNVGFDF